MSSSFPKKELALIIRGGKGEGNSQGKPLSQVSRSFPNKSHPPRKHWGSSAGIVRSSAGLETYYSLTRHTPTNIGVSSAGIVRSSAGSGTYYKAGLGRGPNLRVGSSTDGYQSKRSRCRYMFNHFSTKRQHVLRLCEIWGCSLKVTSLHTRYGTVKLLSSLAPVVYPLQPTSPSSIRKRYWLWAGGLKI